MLGLRFGDVDSGIGENLEGHIDVGPAGHTVTPVAQVEAERHRRRGEEETRDELARGPRGDLEMPPAQLGPRMDRQGQGVVDRGDGRAEAGEGVDRDVHRPCPGLLIPVDDHLTAGGRGDRGDEAHDGPRETAVDRHRFSTGSEVDRGDVEVVAGLRDLRAEAAQGADHELGVAAAQPPADDRLGISERGKDEIAVGQRLRPGNRDDGVEGLGSAGRPPVAHG
ncbi:Uncharacterised protein [Mycobacteroides abscessus subsp. abscessus]|nr:Uncharacterised protein [Mycobacteroides abscessus subsp. abscessus]